MELSRGLGELPCSGQILNSIDAASGISIRLIDDFLDQTVLHFCVAFQFKNLEDAIKQALFISTVYFNC